MSNQGGLALSLVSNGLHDLNSLLLGKQECLCGAAAYIKAGDTFIQIVLGDATQYLMIHLILLIEGSQQCGKNALKFVIHR